MTPALNNTISSIINKEDSTPVSAALLFVSVLLESISEMFVFCPEEMTGNEISSKIKVPLKSEAKRS